MKFIAVLGALLIAMSAACMAADNPKVTLNADSTALDQVITDLSKQAGVQIILDKDIKGTVSGHFESIELEKLLDAITKPNDLKWRKIYLPVPKDENTPRPTVDQIKARAEAVQAVTTGAIAVYDPATGKQKVFVEQDPKALSVDPDKLGMKPIYLITKPKVEAKADDAASKDNAKKYKSLADERMKMLQSMTPAEREAAMQQEMVQMMTMTPDNRQNFMSAQMNAIRNMDPGLQQQFFQTMRDTFQSMGGQGGGFGGGMGGNGGGGGRGNRGDRGGGGTVVPAQ